MFKSEKSFWAPKTFLIQKRKQSQLIDYLTCVGKIFDRKKVFGGKKSWYQKSLSQNFLVKKKFWSKKCLVKNLWSKKILVPKIFLVPKKFGPPKKMLVPKKFLDAEKLFVPKKNLVPENFLFPEKIMVPQKFLIPEKFLVLKKILVPK